MATLPRDALVDNAPSKVAVDGAAAGRATVAVIDVAAGR